MSNTRTFADSKAVLQVVMPATWVDRISELAVERGMNRSALIREAIELVYFREQTPKTNLPAPLPGVGFQQTKE